MRSKHPAKWLLDFYLFGNFHIAFCAVALTLSTKYLFNLQLRHELLVFVFCGTFFGYNLQRLPSAFDNNIQRRFLRHHWNTQNRILLTTLSLVAAGAFAWSYSRLYLRSQIVALVPAALSFAYAFRVVPTKKGWIRLREIPGVKIFVIAITWGISCALLPAAAAHVQGHPWFTLPILLWSVVCGLLIFALTVPFDVRDFDYDVSRLKALPAILGIRGSINVAIGALFVSAGITWLILLLHEGTIAEALAYTLWCVITSFFIYKSTPQRHEYYFSFTIDGLILLLGAMLLAAHHYSSLL